MEKLELGWSVLVSILGFVVWLVRLEGRVSQQRELHESLDKRVGTLSAKHDLLDSKTIEQLAQVRESLARIEGALGVKKD